MLRAISEMAVAMSVGSGRGNPSRSAMARASALAVTRSASRLTATRTSSVIDVTLAEAVEHDAQRLEVQAELHHRDRDVRLDPHDHGLRPAEPDRQHDRPQRARDERVDHVQRGDVDDEPAGAVAPHEVCELLAQLDDLAVGEVGLDGGDEVVALPEDGD